MKKLIYGKYDYNNYYYYNYHDYSPALYIIVL